MENMNILGGSVSKSREYFFSWGGGGGGAFHKLYNHWPGLRGSLLCNRFQCIYLTFQVTLSKSKITLSRLENSWPKSEIKHKARTDRLMRGCMHSNLSLHYPRLPTAFEKRKKASEQTLTANLRQLLMLLLYKQNPNKKTVRSYQHRKE